MARTVPGYRLFDLGGYPGLVEHSTDREGVTGEVWSVDAAALRRLVEFQIRNGTDGIVPCGTTGEAPTLSFEEHERSHADQVFKDRFSVLATLFSDSQELGYEMLWQGGPES